MPSVFFTTLGCKTNHYDSDALAEACVRAGYMLAPAGREADVHVINTCTVTAASDVRGRNIIRGAVRRKGRGKVVVCGCGPKIDAQRYRRIEGVDHVMGARSEIELVDILKRHFTPSPPLFPARSEGETVQPRARAFLKIQDGCDSGCAYCIVPAARGPARSVSVDHVLTGVKKLEAQGFKEVVLTGIHIGRYGRDLKEGGTLAGLIEEMLALTDSCRIRITSLDPDEVEDGLVRLLSHPRVCRHLHLSLQSGSDAVLEMMMRRKGAAVYAERIEGLAKEVPGIAIGADIITGFPGETVAHFEETKALVERLPFAYLHVFPYSQRPGTPAATMKDQVPVAVRRSRARELLEISARKRDAFYKSRIGERLDVIIVSKRPNGEGLVKGIGDNYVPVYLCGDGLKYREIYNVEICTIEGRRRVEGVMGRHRG